MHLDGKAIRNLGLAGVAEFLVIGLVFSPDKIPELLGIFVGTLLDPISWIVGLLAATFLRRWWHATLFIIVANVVICFGIEKIEVSQALGQTAARGQLIAGAIAVSTLAACLYGWIRLRRNAGSRVDHEDVET